MPPVHPGVGKNVIGVASYDNAQRAFTVAGTPYGYNPATGSPLAPLTGSLPMSKSGTTTTVDDLCVARPAGTFTGTAVLIRRGTCSFFIKASNAMNAGAAAVVLYNNAAGALAATVAGTPPITIPVVGITAAQGAALDAAIAAGPTTLNWGDQLRELPLRHGRPDLRLQLLRHGRRPEPQAATSARRVVPSSPATRWNWAARPRCRAPRCRRRTWPAAWR